MKIRNITEFKSSKWSGGTTTELFIYPENSSYKLRNFLFRLSSATIDEERSIFTNLEGFKRFIAPLEGELNISHNQKDFKSLSQNELYTFDGAVKTISTGRCRDFNLMVKNKTEAYAKNCSLAENQKLSLEILQNEILWLFSYQNSGIIKISCHDNLLVNSKLKQMNLFVFEAEKSDDKRSEITIATDEEASLFYGKIIVL